MNLKSFTFVFSVMLLAISSCTKPDYSFGDIKNPTNVQLSTTVVGADAINPNGNGTGTVTVTTTATDALTYKIDFGDGKSMVVPSGTINYKYTTPGTFDYVITVNAVGTGGTTSTVSKKVTVFVAFEIPAAIVQGLTGGTSKVWVTDKEAPGHVGVGPADGFAPTYYAAAPNERQPCQYDDEITFSKDANNNIIMNIDNKGQTFIIGAATGFYGFGGGDGCYPVTAAGPQKLSFMDATSSSTTANSTRIQFSVPGNGIVNFATGANTYEILSSTDNTIHLRNIGIDGNAWYQKLKVKS